MSRRSCLPISAAILGAWIAFASPPTIDAQTVLVGDEHKISATEGGFAGAGGAIAAGDNFGRSMAFVDGATDLMAVGAPLSDSVATDQGSVWLFEFDGSSVVSPVTEIAEGSAGFTGALSSLDWFGYSVAAFPASHPVGDLNGDGISDLVVGAPRDNDGGAIQGAVWILFLNPDGTVKAHRKISETSVEGFTGPLAIGDSFGESVCPVGDLDSNGIPDLAVGASFANSSQGAVWILLFNDVGFDPDAIGSPLMVKSQHKIAQSVGGFAGPLPGLSHFGASLSAFDATGIGGDLNGDGFSELVVGAPTDGKGCFWVLYLKYTPAPDMVFVDTVSPPKKVTQGLGGFVGPLQNDERFGDSLSCMPDMNGDGMKELIVGTRRDIGLATDQGSVWILSLGTNGTVGFERFILEGNNTCHDMNGPLDAVDHFGISCATGNWNGGNFDLGVGASLDDDGGLEAGAVWILETSLGDLAASLDEYNDPAPTDNIDFLTATEPVIGSTWTVSFTRNGGGNGRFQVRIWSNRLSGNGIAPTTGSPPWPAGTAGRRIAGGPYFGSIPAGQSVSGFPVAPTLPFTFGVGTATAFIPCEPAFLGIHFACQARSGTGAAGSGTPRLTSAIEGTIGTF